MKIDCPSCGKSSEIDGDDLPKSACDSEEFECHHCEVNFNIGWYATAEVR